MRTIELTSDSRALVLLCSYLALPKSSDASPKPLSAVEWSQLARRVRASEWRAPSGLFRRSAAELWESLGVDQQLAERVVGLLDREGQLAIELERLQSRGIHVLTRIDESYPPRLKRRLRAQAPVVLFYAGRRELLTTPGVAVAGSRDVDADGQLFAAELGRRAAAAGLTIYSGGARGVDQVAMTAALRRGGTAVGIVADSLERMLRDPETRKYIADDGLTLVTPFHPAIGFTVANAMARNKLVYCLADLAVVVSSSLERGGTRAGALENLRAGWVPLFVRAGARASQGNQALIAAGGIPLSPDALPNDADFRRWFDERACSTSADESDRNGVARQMPPESRSCAGEYLHPPTMIASAAEPADNDLFPLIWPHLRRCLQEWRAPKDVAATFRDLQISQARAWLDRAVQEGLAEKQKRRAAFRVPNAQRVVQHAMPLPDAGRESDAH